MFWCRCSTMRNTTGSRRMRWRSSCATERDRKSTRPNSSHTDIYSLSLLDALPILSERLCHLYALVPLLDDEKHYWVTQDEVEKLLRYGEGWLATHPEREVLAARYLKHQRGLAREA